MLRNLIVLPDDSARPILNAIDGARSTLRIKMFVFTDPSLLAAVIAARRRGVDVRVLLNPRRRNGVSENDESKRQLEEAGVAVRDSNPVYDVTHEKSMVLDDQAAFIQSLNWHSENLTSTRDYAIVTTHPHEVAEVIECFEADWSRQDFMPLKAHLVWCRGNGRERISQFIDQARHWLWLQNERYQDQAILEHLVQARDRGVKIHVMARTALEGQAGLRMLSHAGIKVRKMKTLKLHAKMLLADGERAIVGSINLAPSSFDRRRELAIEVDDAPVVARLERVVKHDWKHSQAMQWRDEVLPV